MIASLFAVVFDVSIVSQTAYEFVLGQKIGVSTRDYRLSALITDRCNTGGRNVTFFLCFGNR